MPIEGDTLADGSNLRNIDTDIDLFNEFGSTCVAYLLSVPGLFGPLDCLIHGY